MKAAVCFLLLTSITWISVINSTCYCSSNGAPLDIHEVKSCPHPSVFASEPSTTFTVSAPLLTLDELVQHFNTAAAEKARHPFEDLWEFIHFIDGSSVNIREFIFDVTPFISSAVECGVEYFENSSIHDAPGMLSDIKDKFPSVSEMKEHVTPILDAVEEKVSPYVSEEIVSPVASAIEEKIAPLIDTVKDGLEHVINSDDVARVRKSVAPIIDNLEDKVFSVYSAMQDSVAPIVIASIKNGTEWAINNAKNGIPDVSMVQENVAPFLDTVEDKAASVISAAEEKVAPIIDSIKDQVESVANNVEVSRVQESVAPFVDDLEDKAASVYSAAKEKASSIVKNVEEQVMPSVEETENVSDSESGASEEDIPDEEDYTSEFVFDDSEVEQESADSEVATPSVDEEKQSRFYRMLQSLLAMSVIGLLSVIYFFILSIIVYVFLKDYFNARHDAENNEHFRELLHQIRNEHKIGRPKVLALPPPPPSKKDQEQQTDDEDDNGGEDEFPPIDEEGCSSEADVSMRDTTSSRA